MDVKITDASTLIPKDITILNDPDASTITLSDPTTTITVATDQLTINASAESTQLANLQDVVVTNVQNNQVLAYDTTTSKWINENQSGSSGTVTSVNTQTGAVTLDTDDIAEDGSPTNKYFTDARARASISASGSLSYNSGTGALTYTQGNTDTVAEGSSNLYYTNARFDTQLGTKTTANLTEGSNKYYTDARVQTKIDANSAGFITASSTTALTNKSGNISQWTNDSSYITASSTTALTNKSGNISQWTNDSGYLTSETDSQTLSFSSPNLSISSGNSVNISAITSAYLPLTGGALTGALTTNSTIDGVDIATRDGVLTTTTTTANAALPKTGGAMTGAITTNSTFDGVDIATRDGVLTTTTTTANAALPTTGGAMTGAITTNSTFDGVDIATRDGVLTSTTTTANAALPKAGGTMSGAIAMGTSKITGMGDPTANQDAATKAYVDSEVSSGTVTPSSTNTFTNKTIDANGTGNSITNLEVADLASGVLDTDLSSVSASDDTLASAKAIKTYVDAGGGAVTSYTNGTDNRVVTSTGTNGINGESGFTYDGSNAVISGSASGLTSPILELVTDNSGWNRPLLLLKDSNDDVNTIGGENNTSASVYTYNFTMDPNNTKGRTGVSSYAGDYFFGFSKNYSDQSAISMDMNVYGANGGFNITARDDFNSGGGNQYGLKPINLKGNEINLMPGGSAVALKSTVDTLSINTNVEISDTLAIKFENSGTLQTQIDKDEITAKGSFKVNVDSDNSGNEEFKVQSAGTDALTIVRGPGGQSETTLAGDGVFIKDDAGKTNFSMDLSSASNTGINVIRSNENKSLSFTLKTDDNDDTGNYDGSWTFRQDADKKKLILERLDGSATNIFEIRDSADVATADPVDIFEFKIPPVLPSFVVASLPTTVVAGAQAFCTNETGGAVNVFFDGTSWRRCTDRAVAS